MNRWRAPHDVPIRIAGLAAAAALFPSPAGAYHETIGIGGGAPVHVLIILAIAVAVALVLLSRWQPAKRGGKKAKISTRPSRKARKRG